MERRKLILDCDPGHDDAVAILLAANSPALELLGVTVTAGNQTLEKTARNACRVLQWVGKTEIPVYAGCDRPMVRDKLVAAAWTARSSRPRPSSPSRSTRSPS